MKIKRAMIYILASCTMLSSMSLQGISFGSVSAADADNGVMRDNITAKQIADEMGLGINLGNTMEAYWLDSSRVDSGSSTGPGSTPQDFEKCWGAVVTTQEAINGMKAAGFNTVRIPVYWGNMMEEDGTFTINPKYIGRVKEIVDYCRNAGLYAVINIHHYDEFVIRRFTKNDDLDGCADVFKHLWTQIAEYFKDYSDYLVFEGYNESLGAGPLDENGNGTSLPRDKAYLWTNTLNQTFVDAVRATGGNNTKRLLVASGYYTNIDNTTKDDFKIPEDNTKDRLMVSVHYVDNSMYWTNQIGSKKWQEYSISQLELLNKAFTAKDIPVFIGETTGSYIDHFASNAIINDTTEALDYMLRLIKSYGFVPVIWDTNNGFYSRTECKIKSQKNEAVINKLSKELEDGTFEKIVEPSDITPTNPSEKPSDAKPSDSSSSTSPNPSKTSATAASTTASAPKSTRNTEAVNKNKSAAKKAMKQAKISKLKVKSKAKKKINVTWKKVKKAKGYQVQVSAKKNFKKVIFKKELKKTKLNIKNKKIKSKKTYYVRVRAYATYKNANNKTVKVYSKWNKKLRKVKVK